MKLASLLAGVAAATMVAGAASADAVYQGSTTPSVNVAGFQVAGPTVSGNIQGNVLQQIGAAAVLAVDLANPTVNDNVALFTISGGSLGNIGTASNSDGATFTMNGNVSTDCAYYTGNASTTVNFGQIGIYAEDNTGPAAAFDMVAPASLDIDTNLAGCNTRNTVSLSKNDIRGLVNNSGAGYDTDVFQANLPYSVTAGYKAGAVGSVAAAPNTTLTLASNANAAQAQHGAWKSAMEIDVSIPVPSKSLLAGAYTGTLTLAITAF